MPRLPPIIPYCQALRAHAEIASIKNRFVNFKLFVFLKEIFSVDTSIIRQPSCSNSFPWGFLCPSQILFSADDEMDESDEDDVRRLAGLKTVKKKKHRMGIPV